MVHTIIGSSFSVTIETSCRMDSARKNNGGKIPFDPIIEDISFDIAWMQVGVALTTTIRITSTNKNTFLEIWMISQHIRIKSYITLLDIKYLFSYLTNLGIVKACGHWKSFFQWRSVILKIALFNGILQNEMILISNN